MRREAGEEEVAPVHCDEGVANRAGSEPCVVGREAGGEASAGERIGQPLSRERINRGADAVVTGEGETGSRAHRTQLHARVARVSCPNCGVRKVATPWARASSGFTLLFEAYVLALAKAMPIANAAKRLGEHDTRLWRIVEHYVWRAVEALDLSQVRRIAADETSARRGHDYVSLFVDMARRKVIYVADGKDAATVKEFADFLEAPGSCPGSALPILTTLPSPPARQMIDVLEEDVAPALDLEVVPRFLASHLVDGLVGEFDDVEFVERDLGVLEVRLDPRFERRPHVDAGVGDRLALAAVRCKSA